MNRGQDHDHFNISNSGFSAVRCPMIMTFHGGHCERILWKSWVASTVTEFVFSCMALFVMAFSYEALKSLREYFLQHMTLEKNSKERNGACPKDKSYLRSITAGSHLLQTLLSIIQVVISYLLMLVVMTFNYWIFLAVMLGLGIGYFCFGWIKRSIYDNECCH